MKLSAQPLANAIAVPRLLIKELGIKISDTSLKLKLEEHVDFPSLIAISDCLSEWNIPNLAVQIPKEKYNVDELQFPFIAQIPFDGGQFMLVHEIENGTVVYSDEKLTRKRINESDFLKSWAGVLLYAEANQESGEKNYLRKQIFGIISDLKIPLLILVLLAFLVFGIDFSAASSGYILFLALSLLGSGISALLLTHSLNANNPLIQNLCSLGKKNNCNAILKSDAAKVTSWLSWSEVGFFYFTGCMLSLLTVPSSLPVLMLLNILAIPYTFWSIYYQYSNKNWCILCCSVQAILWLELIVVLATISMKSNLYIPSSYLGITLSFLLPISLWFILKPLLQKASEYRLLKQQLKKFKYNSDLFTLALIKQPRYAIPDDIAPITLGNPNAQTIITMVSNPFCNPCAEAHEIFDKWIKNRFDIQLKIVFATPNNDNDPRTKVAKHVTALGLVKNVEMVEEALNQWYRRREKKYEDWAKNYEIEITQSVHDAVKKQKQWCNLIEVTGTPTVLINGYKLPKPYSIEDIQYLVD